MFHLRSLSLINDYKDLYRLESIAKVQKYTEDKVLKNQVSLEGIRETEELLEIASLGNFSNQINTNFTIVRGLAYYDGFCVETTLNFKVKNLKGKEIDIGSIASGGRYDKLISRFKGADFPGTGMSIGVDRLLFAINQINEIKVKNNDPTVYSLLTDPQFKFPTNLPDGKYRE